MIGQPIRGAADGGTAFEPLKHGDMVLTDEDELLRFDCYGFSGWFGFFTREGSTVALKLPIAGLRIVHGEPA